MNKNISTRELSLYWLEQVVIGLELCPFAKVPYQKGLVRLIENGSTLESDQLSFFLDELDLLQQTPTSEISTTLIVYVNDDNDFQDFNDFVGLCDEMMIEAGLEEHFQLVAFHPAFVFEGRDVNHRANWIGRSPYPTLHILRNSEIEMALSVADKATSEAISEKNEEKLLKLSDTEFQKLFHYLC